MATPAAVWSRQRGPSSPNNELATCGGSAHNERDDSHAGGFARAQTTLCLGSRCDRLAAPVVKYHNTLGGEQSSNQQVNDAKVLLAHRCVHGSVLGCSPALRCSRVAASTIQISRLRGRPGTPGRRPTPVASGPWTPAVNMVTQPCVPRFSSVWTRPTRPPGAWSKTFIARVRTTVCTWTCMRAASQGVGDMRSPKPRPNYSQPPSRTFRVHCVRNSTHTHAWL